MFFDHFNITSSYIHSWLAEHCTTVVKQVARNSHDGQPLKSLIKGLKEKYSVPGAPWDVLLPPGTGTFEGYVGWGGGCAASADGRRAGSPIASDCSAAPTPLDKPAVPKTFDIYRLSQQCVGLSILRIRIFELPIES